MKWLISNQLKRIHFFILFLFLVPFAGVSQTNADLQALESKVGTANGIEKARLLNNLANGYLLLNVEKSLKYANEALKLSQKIKNNATEAEALNLLGAVYYKKRELKKSAAYYEDELKIREKSGDKQYIARAMFNVAVMYKDIDKQKKAIEMFEGSLKLAKDNHLTDLVYSNYTALYSSYYARGKYKEALDYYKLYVAMKDSSINMDKAKQINVLVSQYEAVKTEKEKTESELQDKSKELKNKSKELNNKEQQLQTKEQQLDVSNQKNETLKVESKIKDMKIDELNYETAYKEQQIQNHILQRNLYIAGIVFGLLLTILLSVSYILKERANRKLAHQNELILQQKEEIQAQSDEIQAQRDDLVVLNESLKQQKEEIQTQSDEIEAQRDDLVLLNEDLKQQKEEVLAQRDEIAYKSHIIETKNEEITKSINYALRIQQAILPPKKEIYSIFPNSFVLYRPKDIVSGDFYWYYFDKNVEITDSQHNSTVLFAAADCTGHGVPGAFMSMIGTQILAITASASSDPAQILSKLNNEIKVSLHQNDDEGTTKDGMDIALVSINLRTRQITYSGANRPLWIIKKGEKEVTEYKATKKAIGGFTETNQIFELNTIQLAEGDTIYLSSDGYADQFGGSDGRKFMTKKFKELLSQIQHTPMNEQEEYLNNCFDDWRGENHQIDDVMVVGIRV